MPVRRDLEGNEMDSGNAQICDALVVFQSEEWHCNLRHDVRAYSYQVPPEDKRRAILRDNA